MLLPLYLLAFVIDIAANYTELALLTWDWPLPGEYTFSKRLPRLMQIDDWRGSAARKAADYLNYFDPGHIRE